MNYERHELNATIEETLNPLIGTGVANICIIDPPSHFNVGDSAILLGELDYLARNFPRARLSFYDVDSYSSGADRYIAEADVLLLHGGGNFGDLWPHHHAIRAAIVKKFPDKAIVQFPQSIFFQNHDNVADTAAWIEEHGNLTLCVRDAKSYTFAQQHFQCRVLLTPDMAFAMKPIQRTAFPSADFFCLLRADKEAVADHEAILQILADGGYAFESRDWLDGDTHDLVTRLDRRLRAAVAKRPRMMSPFRSQLMSLRRKNAELRVASGIALLSRGTFVVTDRLHAHILASLLGIRNVAFDSLDGKISALVSTWASPSAAVTTCASTDELARRIGSFERSTVVA